MFWVCCTSRHETTLLGNAHRHEDWIGRLGRLERRLVTQSAPIGENEGLRDRSTERRSRASYDEQVWRELSGSDSDGTREVVTLDDLTTTGARPSRRAPVVDGRTVQLTATGDRVREPSWCAGRRSGSSEFAALSRR